MSAAVNGCAWDGAWYARAFDDAGLPLGVAGEAEQEISLNPQTWAIIGQVADPEQARLALESAHTRLNTRFGLALMGPPYTRGSDRVRGTSTYPPGAKENGGIFCHANTWAIIAAAQLGLGDRAYQYYRQILPLARHDSDVYAAEPYVYSQNICGPEHDKFGLARNAWLTGTASWTYVAGTQYILGIRPTYRGLQIDPCIPREWKGFKATRHFRGADYEIEVKNPAHVSRGVAEMQVDGEMIAGSTVPLFHDGLHKVVVTLG
jgi:cellobiose phosphorylase